MNRHPILLSAIAAAAIFASSFASAEPGRLVIDAPTHADLTMAQAVVIAESMGNGRATGARLEGRDAGKVYRVTVQAAGKAPQKIDVAAADGRIVASERRRD
jgi:uncharacterized membrane protein YkoI